MKEQKKPSQKQRVLEALRENEMVSTRYFKQQFLISEVNGRISELRSEGYVIETLDERDEYGFAYHRLVSEPAAKQLPLAV
jgi:hypothetical protein